MKTGPKNAENGADVSTSENESVSELKFVERSILRISPGSISKILIFEQGGGGICTVNRKHVNSN